VTRESGVKLRELCFGSQRKKVFPGVRLMASNAAAALRSALGTWKSLAWAGEP
jgi:hypothetical protein